MSEAKRINSATTFTHVVLHDGSVHQGEWSLHHIGYGGWIVRGLTEPVAFPLSSVRMMSDGKVDGYTP